MCQKQDMTVKLGEIQKKTETSLQSHSPESIEEEEAFEVYREQQYATVARRGRETEGGTGGKGARNNLQRMVS